MENQVATTPVEIVINDKQKEKEQEKSMKELKQCMLGTSILWIKAGGIISSMHKNETYKYQKKDDGEYVKSFSEFCTLLPLPSSTNAGRIRTAYRMMNAYDEFVVNNNIDVDRLADIGYSKLSIAYDIKKNNSDISVTDLLSDAETLTSIDLIKKYKTNNQTLEQLSTCKHEHTTYKVFKYTYCSDCKETITENITDEYNKLIQ